MILLSPGSRKGEKDDLVGKVGLARDRVLTENMKLSAVEAIRKFYYGKGYRNVQINMTEEALTGVANSVALHFDINKGRKVKINSLNFSGNESVSDLKLKKQMKGTKGNDPYQPLPEKIVSPYGDVQKYPSFRQYLKKKWGICRSARQRVYRPLFPDQTFQWFQVQRNQVRGR